MTYKIVYTSKWNVSESITKEFKSLASAKRFATQNAKNLPERFSHNIAIKEEIGGFFVAVSYKDGKSWAAA
jgi:hypothetical protein